ncbi:MAG TPA: hypothetical protein VJH94_01050 [Candidatus Paceibacterota bacterium]
MTSEKFSKLNAERLDLINKKFRGGGLTLVEEQRLAQLQAECKAFADEVPVSKEEAFVQTVMTSLWRWRFK